MLKLIITGDFCPVNRIERITEDKRYELIFNDFASVLEQGDFNITNLECPLYNGNELMPKIGTNLKVNESFVDILKEGKFHLVTLANNHIMDFGVNGLQSTMTICRKERIEFVGVGLDLHEARRIFYKTINGIRIAILNFAENEFSTTHGNYPGANPLNPIANFYDIQEARENADFVFVIIHGGHEHYQLPSPRMQETYRFFVDAGADAVIGHHAHCYSGYEIYKSKPIFYGLGNFVFDSFGGIRNGTWTEGFAVCFSMNDGAVSFTLHPYTQGKEENPGVHLMKDSDLDLFYKNIDSLNRIICDPEMLKNEYQKFVQSKKSYLSSIEPYSNRYLMALHRRGLLPSLLSKKKKRLLLNLIRCEAHRDVLVGLLNEVTK